MFKLTVDLVAVTIHDRKLWFFQLRDVFHQLWDLQLLQHFHHRSKFILWGFVPPFLSRLSLSYLAHGRQPTASSSVLRQQSITCFSRIYSMRKSCMLQFRIGWL